MTSNKCNEPSLGKLAWQIFFLTILIVVLGGVFTISSRFMQSADDSNIQTLASTQEAELAIMDADGAPAKTVADKIAEREKAEQEAEKNNERDGFIKSLDPPKSASTPDEAAKSIIFR